MQRSRIGSIRSAFRLGHVAAYSFVAYGRLVERGLAARAFASALARFGIAQVYSGRRVGVRLNIRDVMNQSRQERHQCVVQSIYRWSDADGTWREQIVEDRRSTPAEIAAARLDIAAWLASLSPRLCAIATTLAIGESTSEVARKFRVSAGRISQLRRELEKSWRRFQGEVELAAA